MKSESGFSFAIASQPFAHLQKADWDEDNDPEKYFAAKFFEKKPERPSTDKLVWWIARHTIAPRMP